MVNQFPHWPGMLLMHSNLLACLLSQWSPFKVVRAHPMQSVPDTSTGSLEERKFLPQHSSKAMSFRKGKLRERERERKRERERERSRRERKSEVKVIEGEVQTSSHRL